MNTKALDKSLTEKKLLNKTGEVYIGTDRGLISYKSDATKGTETHNQTAVIAYPNPVRPEYKGDIAIKGLAENAYVKITDVNGTLMYETRAFGGQAVWNANDYTGRRAATGVYLIFSSNRDGTDNIVSKLLIVN